MNRKRLPLYILIVLAAAAGVLAVCLLSRNSSVETAPVVLPTPTASASATAGDDSEHVVSVTPDTVQAVVGTLTRADSYSRTLTAEDIWKGGSSTRTIQVWVHGGSARFTVSGSPEKNILLSGGDVWIWYADASGVYHGKASDRDADEYQALLTYEDLLNIDRQQITDAGYAQYGGENCVYAVYTGGELGYRSQVWISVATGLLMGSETYDGDTLVYRVTSTAPDISTPDDSVFTHP